MQIRLSQKLRKRLQEGLQETLNEALPYAISAGLKGINELKEFARHPRALGFALDSRSPGLAKRLLGVASNWAEPFTLGMGLRVEQIGEDVIKVIMPDKWRNHGEGGVVHSAALAALGEFAVRLYWEYHLDLRFSEVESRRVQVRMLSRPSGTMKGVFRLPVVDREAILHRLRPDYRAEVETQTLVYDGDGRLMAEVEVDWYLSRRLALGTPNQSSNH